MSVAHAPKGQVVGLAASEGHEVPVAAADLGVSAAEINQQIATAKAYPRSLVRFRQDIIAQATLTEGIAAACLYALPRGGKTIEGPSIRLAEMVLGAWGNCRATTRIVAETDNFIVAQGIFIDLERNVAIGMEVNRRIVDKNGRRFDVDMIGVTGAAASSIALRNAIFRGIPRALWWDAYISAKRTVVGDLKTLAERRANAIAAFKPFGVTEQQIYHALGVDGMLEIGLEHLGRLAGFLTAIEQEERDPEDIFPPAETKAGRAAPKPPAEKKSNKTGAAAPKSGDAGHRAEERAGSEERAGEPGPASSTQEIPQTPLEQEVAATLPDLKSAADIRQLRQLYAFEFANAAEAERERIEAMLAARAAEFVR